jgi:hypothetical protein
MRCRTRWRLQVPIAQSRRLRTCRLAVGTALLHLPCTRNSSCSCHTRRTCRRARVDTATTRRAVTLDDGNFNEIGAQFVPALLARCFRLGVMNMQRYEQKSGGYPHWHSEVYPEVGQTEALHRVLFWICYLNDVERGGGTEFVYQGAKVQPRAGRSLVAPHSHTLIVETHRSRAREVRHCAMAPLQTKRQMTAEPIKKSFVFVRASVAATEDWRGAGEREINDSLFCAERYRHCTIFWCSEFTLSPWSNALSGAGFDVIRLVDLLDSAG